MATTKKTKSVIVQTSQRVGALVVAHEPHTSLRSVCMSRNYFTRRSRGFRISSTSGKFAFSPVDTIDTIYQFCIENNIYDFRIIDELVYEQTEISNPYKADTFY